MRAPGAAPISCAPRTSDTSITSKPESRCLVSERKRVWRFPDDYPRCVADRLLKAYPALRRAGGG